MCRRGRRTSIIRFHLDEHIDPAIAAGLRRRGIDVTTTIDAGLIQASDHKQLAYALAEQRTIVTRDTDFLRLAAGGMSHAGIVFIGPASRTIGAVVQSLSRLHRTRTAEELVNHVEYI